METGDMSTCPKMTWSIQLGKPKSEFKFNHGLVRFASASEITVSKVNIAQGTILYKTIVRLCLETGARHDDLVRYGGSSKIIKLMGKPSAAIAEKLITGNSANALIKCNQ
jgi:hypothetical protein